MPPASGVAPLWTPCLRGLRFDRGSDHPPSPLPVRKAGKLELWGAPQTPAKGLRPLDSCCHCSVIARSEATRQSGAVGSHLNVFRARLKGAVRELDKLVVAKDVGRLAQQHLSHLVLEATDLRLSVA